MCRPLRGALFVEGPGETDAAPGLLASLWAHLRLPPLGNVEVLYRGNDLKNDATLTAQLDRFYRRLARDFDFLLVVFDSDEKKNGQIMCPHDKAPASARIIRAKSLTIPAAVVLPYREYEHWFVACLPQWAGLPIIDTATGLPIGQFVQDTSRAHDEIHRRDAKGIIDRHLARGSYGERTHQPVLTGMLDCPYLGDPARIALADSVGFGPLCRAFQFLAQRVGQPGCVYPPANIPAVVPAL